MPTLVLAAPTDNHGGTAEAAGAQQPTLRAIQPEGTVEFGLFFLSFEQKSGSLCQTRAHRRAHSAALPKAAARWQRGSGSTPLCSSARGRILNDGSWERLSYLRRKESLADRRERWDFPT